MSGGQIAALICAILLLLPGGCFLFFGVSLLSHPHQNYPGPFLLVAAVILSLVGLLFWVAFRHRPPADTGGPPQTPRHPEP